MVNPAKRGIVFLDLGQNRTFLKGLKDLPSAIRLSQLCPAAFYTLLSNGLVFPVKYYLLVKYNEHFCNRL